MGYCNDCGCRTAGRVCSNCHEEAYIIQEQGEYAENGFSDEFMAKAKEQCEQIRKEYYATK